MSETKFTKGQWEATQDRHLQLFVCDENNHDVEICEVLTHNGYDAHLIAAAPDLYEALSLLLSQVDPWVAGYQEAEQALTKARGEST